MARAASAPGEPSAGAGRLLRAPAQNRSSLRSMSAIACSYAISSSVTRAAAARGRGTSHTREQHGRAVKPRIQAITGSRCHLAESAGARPGGWIPAGMVWPGTVRPGSRTAAAARLRTATATTAPRTENPAAAAMAGR